MYMVDRNGILLVTVTGFSTTEETRKGIGFSTFKENVATTAAACKEPPYRVSVVPSLPG